MPGGNIINEIAYVLVYVSNVTHILKALSTTNDTVLPFNTF